MSKLKLSFVAASILLSQAAFAQSPQLAPGQVLGNSTAAQRNAQSVSLTSVLDRAFGTNQGAVFNRGPTVWAATRTPILGLNGSASGTLGFAGLTSGTMTISPQSVAGTGTLLLPNLAGTIVAGAATPLVASATTGIVSCPTCVTSSGGGAITGTAPIVVSGAGAVSVTGSALTKADDTNVTVTLGGTPASALLAATSLTLGWNGQLSLARGGTNAALTAALGAIPYSTATAMALLAPTATARFPLLSGANAAPVWGAFSLPATVTSGGIACFTSTTAESSSALLTASAIVLGGGAGVCPTALASLGTTATVLHGNAAGAPTWGQVVSADIATGTVANSNLAVAPAYTFKGNATGASASPTDIDPTALTAKATPGASDIIVIQDVSASNQTKRTTIGAISSASVAGVSDVNGKTGSVKSYYPPQGRLTILSGTPVIGPSPQTGKTTIYYTPYIGDIIPIYDGTNMVPTQFTEISVATTDTTKNPSAIGANKVNDWFVWNDAGTIRLSHSADWTDDLTRSATLTRQNGIFLNTAAITNACAASRCTWVGTTRSDASSQLNWIQGGLANGGVAGFLGVWNMYNRVDVVAMTGDTGTGYAYNTNSFRQVAGSAGMQVTFVRGINEDLVRADYSAALVSSVAGVGSGFGVGLDSTTIASGIQGQASANTGGLDGVASFYIGIPASGVHYLAALEKGGSSGTTTFYGLTGGFQTGFYVTLRM